MPIHMKKTSIKQSISEIKRPAVANKKGTLLHCNGEAIELDISFARMFGYQKEELKGKNLIKILIPKKYHGIITENIKRSYTGPYGIEGIKKDGSTFPIMIEGSNMNSNNMDVIRIAVFRQLA